MPFVIVISDFAELNKLANSDITITTDYKNPSVVCCLSEFVTST